MNDGRQLNTGHLLLKKGDEFDWKRMRWMDGSMEGIRLKWYVTLIEFKIFI